MSEGKIYSLKELQDLTDSEVLSILKNDWEIPNNRKISVWGELYKHKTLKGRYVFSLKKVKDIYTKSSIEYPTSGVIPISEKGIFITVNDKDIFSKYSAGALLSCDLKLSPSTVRKDHNNPLEVSVEFKSIELLKELPKLSEEIHNDEINSYISQSVYDIYVRQNEETLQKEKEVLEAKLQREHTDFKNLLGKEQEELNKTQFSIEQDVKKVQYKLTATEKTLEQQQTKRERVIQDLQSLALKETELKNDFQALKTLHAEYENDMSKKLKKLESFVKDKATILKDLEFIDDEEFDSLLSGKVNKISSENSLSFTDDFQRDYAKSVSYIQAYLSAQDIIYPRYVLEDFFALIQTNDLIILAGDSGSGKTNLVQSFAKAIGGESRVIPVKPNWTSSEDLLGYYNPLEKKYLSTPFLEALIDAGNNPETPYFICLDEMNLAHVEYYFADFLSKLEERNDIPEIYLYSDDESSHTLSEFKHVIQLITDAKQKYNKEHINNFAKLLQDEEINAELKRVFGFSDKDSLIKYHSDLRRMLGGVLKTPATISFPPNVRIIGAINIDETTNNLSPKILDRAHVIKFESPLLHDWATIEENIKSYGFDDVTRKIHFELEDLGSRVPYPKYKVKNEFCSLMVEFTKLYFRPLGIEVGLRTIRQGLNYQENFLKFNDDKDLAINNFFLHKILPKMTFDGNKMVGETEKYELLSSLIDKLEQALEVTNDSSTGVNAIEELRGIIEKARTNDWIINYWS